MSRWRATKWGEGGVDKLEQAHEIFKAVKALVTASAASKGVSDYEIKAYLKQLQEMAFNCLSTEGVEDMAVRLWTSVERFTDRELCAILTDAIRSDARPVDFVSAPADGADCAADATELLQRASGHAGLHDPAPSQHEAARQATHAVAQGPGCAGGQGLQQQGQHNLPWCRAARAAQRLLRGACGRPPGVLSTLPPLF